MKMSQSEDRNKKNQLIAMAGTGVIMTGLLAGSAVLYVDNGQLKAENAEKVQQIETLETLGKKLKSELEKVNGELTSMQGRNKELDRLLASAKEDIAGKSRKISQLIKENASLRKVQKEVAELKEIKSAYFSRIKELEERLGLLTSQNVALKKENEDLLDKLDDLAARYADLERKVEIASVLKVDQVLAQGFKKAKSGKLVKNNSAAKVDRLTFSIDLIENKVAEKGTKTIYARVITPTGETLPAPVSESGSFHNSDSNVTLPYSVSQKVDYDNERIKVDMHYDFANTKRAKGLYKIEFYCDGYYCGSSQIRLK
jgi:chromosome segregation ATPase